MTAHRAFYATLVRQNRLISMTHSFFPRPTSGRTLSSLRATCRALTLALMVLGSLGATPALAKKDTIHLHESIMVVPLTKNTFVHISYIPYKGQKFYCNGLVYVNNGEAVVLDAPTTDSASIYLIKWIVQEQHATIKAIVVNHFHEDCTGGLHPFFGYGALTYSQKKTCKLSDIHGYYCTERYFEDTLTLNIGGQKVLNYYPGEAHTVDNIVTYIPSERVLFGGCMIKCLGANYGNTAHANIPAWPKTVRRVKARYPDVKIVVPGHGAPGSSKLFDYTIKLFETYQDPDAAPEPAH